MTVYRGPSEAQANAEALARRTSPYTAAHETSVRIAWDYRRREPSDLREAVRLARRAYSDEVPPKLHEGYDSIGDDGTPKMTARAIGYIFGHDQSDDAARDPETGQRDLVGYHHTPFRAALDRLAHGSESERKRSAIVSHITIGSQGPKEAAISEGVPHWIAAEVAEMVLRSFLRAMTDIRIHEPVAEGTTSA